MLVVAAHQPVDSSVCIHLGSAEKLSCPDRIAATRRTSAPRNSTLHFRNGRLFDLAVNVATAGDLVRLDLGRGESLLLLVSSTTAGTGFSASLITVLSSARAVYMD